MLAPHRLGFMTKVKICGLKSAAMVQTCLNAGADYLGFNFVQTSPRFISIAEVQPLLAMARAAGVKTVGLWQQRAALPLNHILASGIDILQAHGADPGPVHLPVWRAMGISSLSDLPRAPLPYAQLLFDAKPPKGAAIEGGHGLAFDWTILQNYTNAQPWMLAGGLRPENVAHAIEISGALGVDVSSGVERSPGEKDANLIQDFIQAAKGANV